jgi:hypothetical protein
MSLFSRCGVLQTGTSTQTNFRNGKKQLLEMGVTSASILWSLLVTNSRGSYITCLCKSEEKQKNHEPIAKPACAAATTVEPRALLHRCWAPTPPHPSLRLLRLRGARTPPLPSQSLSATCPPPSPHVVGPQPVGDPLVEPGKPTHAVGNDIRSPLASPLSELGREKWDWGGLSCGCEGEKWAG